MFCSCAGMGLLGINAYKVSVEVDISGSFPGFDIVGLPDTAVKESRDRVRTAIMNSGYEFPLGKIVVNLAPGDIKKAGSLYDLPILMGILIGDEQIKGDISETAFIGEVSLKGDIVSVNGILPMLLEAKKLGIKRVFIPIGNAPEGAVAEDMEVYAVSNVEEVIGFVTGKKSLKPLSREDFVREVNHIFDMDFSEVKGQHAAKRAMEIAAAGSHNILLIGTPGSGKSMLAKRLPTILPEMTYEESIETTKIHSICGVLTEGASLVTRRPFRSPHHTVSSVGLVGGGTVPRPGEVSLANNGVLFLDEFPEYSRSTMEALRQPMEDGIVTISRASGSLSYPCSMMLVAAMNPCPCGYYGHETHRCTCSEQAVEKYINKISGPILDRIDIHVELLPLNYEELSGNAPEETSEQVRERVNRAREIQNKRYKGTGISCNAKLLPGMMKEFCVLTPEAEKMLKTAYERLGLSARGYDKLVKIARTIADLAGSEKIDKEHIMEAVQYRKLDRKYWRG